MTVMTDEQREAAQGYLSDLEKEFRETAAIMWEAKESGDTETYEWCVKKSRVIYREAAEVQTALDNGTIPAASETLRTDALKAA